MSTLRVLVVGAGGREHALAWRLARDAAVGEVLVAPGNEGMAPHFRRLPAIGPEAAALVAACRAEQVGLVVIGPEAPLAGGLADALAAAGIPVYGPSAAAARLESSKRFAKTVMAEARVPTARAAAFGSVEDALAALPSFGPPWVLKADGLAAGKGVRVTRDRADAEDFLAECLVRGRFGESGRTVLVEEFLEGEELSVMAVCDGRRVAVLPSARDYKRARDGDQGPNTGGMGAFSPAPLADRALLDAVESRILLPVLEAMARRGTPFRGTLYAGLMVGPRGPAVLEFNCRFGDPETQVVMPLVEGSLANLLQGAARGALDPAAVRQARGVAVGVALVDEGYPDAVRGGGILEGLDAVAERPDLLVFHAATEREGDAWRIRGGRAAYVVARGETVEAARGRAYAEIDKVGGAGWRVRRDIAKDIAPVAGSPGRHDQGA